MSTALKVVEQNTAPAYEITCERDDGTVINLTNCAVTMKLYLNSTQTNTASGHEDCTIIGATEGIVTWQPRDGDLPSAGSYKGDVKVTYIDDTFEVLVGFLKINARALLG